MIIKGACEKLGSLQIKGVPIETEEIPLTPVLETSRQGYKGTCLIAGTGCSLCVRGQPVVLTEYYRFFRGTEYEGNFKPVSDH